MDTPSSESLFSQILLVVQDVQVSIENFEKRLESAQKAIAAVHSRIDTVIASGFPQGDLNAHRMWHETKELPAWKRIIINQILK